MIYAMDQNKQRVYKKNKEIFYPDEKVE